METCGVTCDQLTNRQDGVRYDANGNPAVVNGVNVSWNVESRMSGWPYDPSGPRVLERGRLRRRGSMCTA